MEADPSATLEKLNVSLDKLQAAMAPLLARPLAETRDGLSPLDRAKLDVLLAFAVNNLVWVYLKTRGIDPDKHAVAEELKRVRSYYGKVQDAEGGKPKTRNRLDKAAAHRFITHSLAANSEDGTPANANAALARRQAEAAVRARQTDEASQARRANRFRFVAETAERLGADEAEARDEDEAEALLAEAYEAAHVGEEGEEQDDENDEEEDDGDEEDDNDNEEDGEEGDDAEDDEEDVDDLPVPEPADARVDPPSGRAQRSKRKRAEDIA